MVADDRGQVLLIGGLAVAIVFLTAIPLSNSLVVSESASNADTVADIDQTAEREASVERGLARVLASVDTTNTTAVNNSLQNFTRTYANVSGQQDGVYVNATVDVDESEGSVVESSSGFREYGGGPGGDRNWNLIEDTTRIEAFNMTFDRINGGSNNPFLIEVTNGTDTWELRAYQTGGTNYIETRTTDTGTWQVVCSGDTDIELDVRNGECTVNADSTPVTTEFRSYTYIDGDVTVRFEGGNEVDGNYRLAGEGTFPNGGESAVVVPAVELQYVGPDTSYKRTILVEGES